MEYIVTLNSSPVMIHDGCVVNEVDLLFAVVIRNNGRVLAIELHDDLELDQPG